MPNAILKFQSTLIVKLNEFSLLHRAKYLAIDKVAPLTGAF
jgi:hypothetical protein